MQKENCETEIDVNWKQHCAEAVAENAKKGRICWVHCENETDRVCQAISSILVFCDRQKTEALSGVII